MQHVTNPVLYTALNTALTNLQNPETFLSFGAGTARLEQDWLQLLQTQSVLQNYSNGIQIFRNTLKSIIITDSNSELLERAKERLKKIKEKIRAKIEYVNFTISSNQNSCTNS